MPIGFGKESKMGNCMQVLSMNVPRLMHHTMSN